MAAADPVDRAQIGRIGANISWARTPHRGERTAPARAKSPSQYQYWLDKVTDDGIVQPKDIPAAAENAWRAYQQQLSRKGVEARRAKAAKRQQQSA